jgi:catechol 2,3-dioxygenase-like lactoylglutathione lyase family enzyme
MAMLGSESAIATIPVRDLARARKFYEGTLGLTLTGGHDEEVLVFKSGDSAINVYRSQYAGTNQATALTWSVYDVDAAVNGLKEKGIQFEHYDLPQMHLEGDVHVAGQTKAAWFRDPDGNILAIVNS